MRRWIVGALTLAALGGCNLFGSTNSPPDTFSGWFHVDRPGRATSVTFEDSNLAQVADLGCDKILSGETQWTQDGDAILLPQWTTPTPRFIQDPSTDGGLLASPGMYGAAQEQWLPGATCLICPQGDAGVAVACSTPTVLDGGT